MRDRVAWRAWRGVDQSYAKYCGQRQRQRQIHGGKHQYSHGSAELALAGRIGVLYTRKHLLKSYSPPPPDSGGTRHEGGWKRHITRDLVCWYSI